MTKSDIVRAVSLMLSVTRPAHVKDLATLDEDTLNNIYREYLANAMSTNHQADELRETKVKLIQLQKDYDDLKARLKIDSRASRRPTKKHFSKPGSV